MSKEDKELLLKDLCARLPYEVILLAPNGKVIYQTDGNTGAEILVEEGFKPYLRPMSSMTKDEQEEFFDLIICVDNGKAVVEEDKIYAYNNFIYSHHLDNKNFIEKGLALEAPSDMYNIKIETT